MSKALILWGGMLFHKPEQISKRFADRLQACGYDVDLTDDLSVLDRADHLTSYDLIVINMTMGAISDAQETNLLAAIRGGTGLAGWHGGLADAFRDRPNFHYAVGGQWVAHPGDILPYSVEVIPGHEITTGISSFDIVSEQYYLHVDPAVEVLATTTFKGDHDSWIDGVQMPAAWTKMYGNGRVFYCALGHVDADFDVPELGQLVEQGLVWATRS